MIRPKTIAFVNQYFYPLQNPPAKRMHVFSKYFSEHGWNVKVITGQPNYPTGRLLAGFNSFLNVKTVEGAKVYYVFEIPLRNEGTLKRLMNYLSFSFSVFLSFPVILMSDVIFISSPPLFSSIVAFLWAKIFRKKTVLDIRDLWPESFEAVVRTKKGFAYRILLWFANTMYRHSDLIIAVSNEIKKNISKRTGRKIIVVTNSAKNRFSADGISYVSSGGKKNVLDERSNSKRIKIVYAGIITKAQSIGDFLKSNRDQRIGSKFEWHIVGDGDDLENLRRGYESLDNVFFYGYKDKDFCDSVIKECDVGLVPLAEVEVFKTVLPSKFIEYASFGKPVISNWSREVEMLVGSYESGYFANDKERLVELLLRVNPADLEIKSRNAKVMFESVFEELIVCNQLYLEIDRM